VLRLRAQCLAAQGAARHGAQCVPVASAVSGPWAHAAARVRQRDRAGGAVRHVDVNAACHLQFRVSAV